MSKGNTKTEEAGKANSSAAHVEDVDGVEIVTVTPGVEDSEDFADDFDESHIPPVEPKHSFSKLCKHVFYDKVCPVGIDLKSYLPLLLILLSEGITSSSVSSYMGYLVVDVGAASTTDEAGTWSGILMSSFFLCQFISSFAMGFFSDNFGRRPTLLIGVFGSFATQLCFGFSTNIWMAIALRGANGLLNGNVSVAKVCIAEISDKDNRVKAFTYVGLMVGAGRIIGSTLGGYTARPAIEYSDTFTSDGFFGKFPYALSNICVSSIILFTFVVALLFIKETSKVLEMKRAERARKRRLKKQKKTKKSYGLDRSASPDTSEHDGISMDKINGLKSGSPFEEGHEHSLLKSADTNKKPQNNGTDVQNSEIELENFEEEKKKKGLRWFCEKVKENRYTILVVVMYALGSFVQMTTFSQISTWTVATIKSGGLDFTPRDVGLTTAIGGVATVLSLFFVSGAVIRVLSIITTTRLSGLILVPVLACMPLGNNIARHGTKAGVWGLEGVLVFLWQGTVQILFNTVNVLIPNSVPNSKLAMAQASAQASGAVAKAIGPTVIGIILEWSLLPGRRFPLNYFLTFFILAFVCFVYFILSFFVPKSMNYPYGVYEKMLQEENEKKEKEKEKKDGGDSASANGKSKTKK